MISVDNSSTIEISIQSKRHTRSYLRSKLPDAVGVNIRSSLSCLRLISLFVFARKITDRCQTVAGFGHAQEFNWRLSNKQSNEQMAETKTHGIRFELKETRPSVWAS